MLRLIKLGYNTLLIDADVILFHEPYKYFKGIFSDFQLFNLADASAGYAKANGGTWYVQNAAVGGPV